MKKIIYLSLFVVLMAAGGPVYCLAADAQQEESLFPVDGVFIDDEAPGNQESAGEENSQALFVFLGALLVSVFFVVGTASVYRRLYLKTEEEQQLAVTAYKETARSCSRVEAGRFIEMVTEYDALTAEKNKHLSELTLLRGGE